MMEQLRDLFDAGWCFPDAYAEAFGDDDALQDEARERWDAWEREEQTLNGRRG